MPRKKYIEVPDINIPRRIFVLGIAILTAVVAFGSLVYELVTPKTGWQQIEANNPKTPAPQSFVFTYHLGAGTQNAGAEQKAITAIYTQALDEAYQALSTEAVEGAKNVATLNAHPNEDIQVEPVLYRAFETVQASSSRYIYLAPLMNRYQALYACTYDEAAAFYDPARDEDSRQYAAELAAFATDGNAVQVKLLGENTLRLEVSPAYLDYAKENEITQFVDFGILRNAFLCDAAADALQAQGYENGVVSCYDGYSRNMSEDEFGLSIFDLVEGKSQKVGIVVFQAPAVLVSFQAFPSSRADEMRYYTYADGTIVTPFLNEAGQSHTAAGALAVLSPDGSAAALALRLLPAFTGENDAFAALSDLSWVSSSNGKVSVHGTGFTLK